MEYRYFATTRVTIPVSTQASVALPSNVVSNVSNAMQVVARDSAVLFGLRYTFNQPRS